MPEQPESMSNEALCFTAGPQGAAFGAGVIHAWLASDRPDPRVVTGISTGAITAAAMQRAMFERGALAHRNEASRWEWFEKYVTDTLDRPLDVIWKALPDPVDFLAATTPVRDLSCPDTLQEAERQSRYHFWILTKLGIWFAGLNVSIGRLGTLAVLKVRHAERVPLPIFGSGILMRIWRTASLGVLASSTVLRLLPSFIFHPLFTRTPERFAADELADSKTPRPFPGVRPLFGWAVWLVACLLGAVLALLLASALGAVLLFGIGNVQFAFYLGLFVLLVVASTAGLAWASFKPESYESKLKKAATAIGNNTVPPTPKKSKLDRLSASAIKACCIQLNVVSNYQMKRRIWNRFGLPGQPDPLVQCDEPTKTNLVIVASALQPLVGLNHQCWAHSGMSLVDALTTTCSIQPFFAPTHVPADKIHQWLRKKETDAFARNETTAGGLDLVDGGVIRKNPLPALFNWLQDHRDVAAVLQSDSRDDARIHVIYNVPIEPFDAYKDKEPPDRIDLIEAANVGILMRTRRDTRIEVDQTNFLSRILNAEKTLTGNDSRFLAIFADELAPSRELKFKNPLSPTRDEGLTVAAEGCRRTLGRLYREEIKTADPGTGSIACSKLLSQIAPARKGAQFSCGLPEICAKCTGEVAIYKDPSGTPPLVRKDYGLGPNYNLRRQLPHLCSKDRKRPRITFVASGGVFRGAFHIGLLGAMQTLDITPDLVVGASVGTLMGGALAAMRCFDLPSQQLDLLAELTRTFLRVDETVALTVPVKTAVKQLGLRARKLKISPARLRAAVKAGTASDVGYASTGVPPIVTDTLSQLFIIPPAETFQAGSNFLAGRFAEAAAHLIRLIRENTLDSLGIRYAVIGTSLLEGVARNLMGALVKGVNLNQRQPYLRTPWRPEAKNTAIFCTTAYVNQRWPLVLGRDALTGAASDFRFLYAGLSSSAFPAAFPARQESEVFPGTGLVTNLFCDGGMFDNLPFVPAIEILSETQKLRFQDSGQTPKHFLQDRLNAPDLIISGGFDPLPSNTPGLTFTTRTEVKARTTALGAAVKTDSFVSMSRRVAKQLQVLAEAAPGDPAQIPDSIKEVMSGSVIAGVVNLVPSTELHLNPTFAFARSLGFDRNRVAASIADGCFQTLSNLRKDRWESESEVRKSLDHLSIEIQKRDSNAPRTEGGCPYFVLSCAFADAAREAAATDPPTVTSKAKSEDCNQVYRACGSDPVHKKLITIKLANDAEPRLGNNSGVTHGTSEQSYVPK